MRVFEEMLCEFRLASEITRAEGERSNARGSEPRRVFLFGVRQEERNRRQLQSRNGTEANKGLTYNVIFLYVVPHVKGP